MKRAEYLNTIQGQINQRNRRHLNHLYLSIDQEPQAKKSLSDEGKQFFRAEVKRQLMESKRRAFRSDLILEIDFYTTKDNPPAIHTLTKNYLDLLHKEMPQIDNFSKLLFQDDSQVKVLIVNYHLNIYYQHRPHIYIRAYSMMNFISDVELTERIRKDQFDYIDDWRYQTRRPTITKFIEDRNKESTSELRSELKDTLKKEEKIVAQFGRVTFDLLVHFHTRKLQEQYLKDNKIEVADLALIFQRKFSQNKQHINNPRFEKLWEITSSYISFGFDFLEVGSVPRQTGDRKFFRKSLGTKLALFKNRHSTLFPLLQPIGLTVVFIPPENSPADLDNLARDLVPFVHDIFQPPIIHKHYFNSTVADDNALKEVQLLRKLPKYAITSYQIISIPRRKNDPIDGKIDLIISDGMPPKSNVWCSVDEFIKQWEQHL